MKRTCLIGAALLAAANANPVNVPMQLSRAELNRQRATARREAAAARKAQNMAKAAANKKAAADRQWANQERAAMNHGNAMFAKEMGALQQQKNLAHAAEAKTAAAARQAANLQGKAQNLAGAAAAMEAAEDRQWANLERADANHGNAMFAKAMGALQQQKNLARAEAARAKAAERKENNLGHQFIDESMAPMNSIGESFALVAPPMAAPPDDSFGLAAPLSPAPQSVAFSATDAIPWEAHLGPSVLPPPMQWDDDAFSGTDATTLGDEQQWAPLVDSSSGFGLEAPLPNTDWAAFPATSPAPQSVDLDSFGMMPFISTAPKSSMDAFGMPHAATGMPPMDAFGPSR